MLDLIEDYCRIFIYFNAIVIDINLLGGLLNLST